MHHQLIQWRNRYVVCTQFSLENDGYIINNSWGLSYHMYATTIDLAALLC